MRTEQVWQREMRSFPFHGWLGLVLTLVFWMLNWGLSGIRTHYLFFGLWLGFCLTVDGLTWWLRGSSMLQRSWRRFLALFLLSAPVWWLFEFFNERLQNWHYLGTETFTAPIFRLWATLNFTTVIPAVFCASELAAGFRWIQRLRRGPVIRPTRFTTLAFFFAGWIMLALLLIWPRWFFPFVWISVYFILEPINVWLGNRNLAQWTAKGDWRPVVSLWIGVLICGFFWELWNYYSYPKWIYAISYADWLRIFEMPLLGYGGYLPFALELYAMTHLLVGLAGKKDLHFVAIEPTSPA
jgi:hypothetical protein